MDRYLSDVVSYVMANPAMDNVTAKSAEDAIRLGFEAIKKFLIQGDKVYITGFMNFTTSECKAKKSVNPKTGEEMIIDAYTKVNAKSTEKFKREMAQGRA